MNDGNQECLRAYSIIARNTLRRQDFVLVVNATKNRILSFNTGYIQCQSKYRGKSLAERVSSLKIDDTVQAFRRKQAGIRTNFSNPADCFLHTVETSCSPVAHPNKAAKNARGKYLHCGIILVDHQFF